MTNYNSCDCNYTSVRYYNNIIEHPELFHYKLGTTLYYVNPDKSIFAGVVVNAIIDDVNNVVYTINDKQVVETELFRTYRDAELSAMKNDFKDYAGLLWGLLDEIRESNNKLANFIMNDGENARLRRSLSIKIDFPRCFTQHSDDNDMLDKPKHIDIDRLIIKRPMSGGEGYIFFFVEADTNNEIYSDNVDYEKGILAINDILKSYINKL